HAAQPGGSGPEAGVLAPAARPRPRPPWWPPLLTGRAWRLGRVGKAHPRLVHHPGDLRGEVGLLRWGDQHELEEHRAFELVDGIDHHPPLVPGLASPLGGDATGGMDLDREHDVADPAFPYRSGFFHHRARFQPFETVERKGT